MAHFEHYRIGDELYCDDCGKSKPELTQMSTFPGIYVKDDENRIVYTCRFWCDDCMIEWGIEDPETCNLEPEDNVQN